MTAVLFERGRQAIGFRHVTSFRTGSVMILTMVDESIVSDVTAHAER
jgi:hypothetical protein